MKECQPHDFEWQDGLLLVCKRCGAVDTSGLSLALEVKARLDEMGIKLVDDIVDDDELSAQFPDV